MLTDNRTFYLKAYDKYGRSARGLNWNNIDSQKIRFQIITNILGESEIRKSSIVDAGCGFGDLYVFWFVSKCLPKKYIGVEILQEFYEVAAKSLPQTPTCTVLHKDILKDDLPQVDWYIASGSLNILGDFDTWLFIEKMMQNARKGVVFNILQGTKKSEIFNYKTADEVREFVKSKDLTCKIVDGYLQSDMTVIIQKEKN